jgi:hypothetical protein
MKNNLLTDQEVARFIVNGYHVLELNLPDGLNEHIATQFDGLTSNPGDTVTDTVPELRQVLDHPAVDGAMSSLLGEDFEVQPHRHWHCKQPNSGDMQWHQDGTNIRDTRINKCLGLYYPRTVTPDMGPTVIVPGTQFRNAPTDRMATYTNFRGQIPLTVKAGTFAFTHYDLWHGTAANRTSQKRHMVKFLFRRTKDNAGPTWNHDPIALEGLRNWNLLDKSEAVGDILTFANPLGVSQSDHYKERAIRRQCWEYLMGHAGSVEAPGEG